MGMYDTLKVLMPLPIGGPETEFQTKDTHSQFCDQYELREDGTLWRHAYDMRVNNDVLDVFGVPGVLQQDNYRWEKEVWTGELRFYTSIGKDGWLEYMAIMIDGKVSLIQMVEHTYPQP